MCSKVLFFVQFKALKGALGKVSTTRLKWLTVAISLIWQSWTINPVLLDWKNEQKWLTTHKKCEHW